MTDAKDIAKARRPHLLAMDILDCLKRADHIPWVTVVARRGRKEVQLDVTYKDDPSKTYGIVAPRLFREPAPSPEATEMTKGKDLEDIMEGDYHTLLEHLKEVYPKTYQEFMERGEVCYCDIFTWLYEHWPYVYNVIGIMFRDGVFK